MSSSKRKNYIPLRIILFLIIFIIFTPLFLFILITQYQQTEAFFQNQYEELRNAAELNILNTLYTMDDMNKVIERVIDEDFEIIFERLIEEYENTGRDPFAIDLNALQQETGGSIDFYIISEAIEVIHTTYEPDMGLDFQQYPQFRSRLRRILQEDSYVSDRITFEIRTGQLRKYAYMPSPDNRYLFELGLKSAEFDEFSHIFRLQPIIEQLETTIPYLVSINVYDMSASLVTDHTESVSPLEQENVLAVFEDNQPISIPGARPFSETKYIYADFQDPRYPTDTSRVIQMVYSNLSLYQELVRARARHFLIGIIIILIILFTSYLISKGITSPIHNMITEIERISTVNLDHPITTKTRSELTVLKDSINRMVYRIQGNMKSLRISEDRLREKNLYLSKLIEERNEHIVNAEKMADLGRMIASVAHDLNTPVGIGITAITHLKEKTKEIQTLFAEGKMKKSNFSDYIEVSESSSEMIKKNLEKAVKLIGSFKRLAADQASESLEEFSMYRLLEDTKISMYPSLRKTVHTFSFSCPQDLVITGYPGSYSQIFTNLIHNSLVHGFEGIDHGEINIEIFADNVNIYIYYTDNGKGIPEKDLSNVFEPFFTTKKGKGGTGLGMYIIHKIVHQRLGGRISIENNVDSGILIKMVIPFSEYPKQA